MDLSRGTMALNTGLPAKYSRFKTQDNKISLSYFLQEAIQEVSLKNVQKYKMSQNVSNISSLETFLEVHWLCLILLRILGLL